MATESSYLSGRVSHAETDIQPKVLQNLGITSYFNAVMQCLLRTDLFREEIEHLHQKLYQFQQLHHRPYQQQQLLQEGNNSLLPLTEALVRFAKDGHKQRSQAHLNELLDSFQRHSPKFVVGGQQDSHDFLIHFLNDLRNEEKRCATSESASNPTGKCLTVVDKVFGGHLVTDYTCLSCGDLYRSCEPLLTISLPVVCSKKERPLGKICNDNQLKCRIEEISRALAVSKQTSPKYHRTKTSLKQCFRHFTRFEEIEREYLCLKCQTNGNPDEPDLTTAIKRTLIYDPPAVLVLHMKRFEQVAGGFRKREDKIRYQEILDLGPYCIASCKRNPLQNQNVWYTLFGVIVHEGSLNQGHYVTYVKEGRAEVLSTKAFLQTSVVGQDSGPSKKSVEQITPKKLQDTLNPLPGQWFYINDEYVRRLQNLEEALDKEAYLLFYERIGPPL